MGDSVAYTCRCIDRLGIGKRCHSYRSILDLSHVSEGT